jgi:hypothetical protein
MNQVAGPGFFLRVVPLQLSRKGTCAEINFTAHLVLRCTGELRSKRERSAEGRVPLQGGVTQKFSSDGRRSADGERETESGRYVMIKFGPVLRLMTSRQQRR